MYSDLPLTAFEAWMEKVQGKSYYKNLTQAHIESAEKLR
eukprot:COSAG02_NODE_2349_length_9084_cov_12.922315_5_plen_39_part_00